MSEIALLKSLCDIVTEYEQKRDSVGAAIKAFVKAGNDLKAASIVSGTWGATSIDIGSVHEHTIAESLLKSAWRHVYDGLNIDRIASAEDKRRFEQSLAKPAPFTLENIRASFGDYLLDPKGNILRGLAEVFCGLDPYYKSHEKVKIGVSGLPKRVIISHCNSAYGWGRDKVRDILNALAAYQRKSLISHQELELLWKDETALLKESAAKDYQGNSLSFPARGVRLRRFSNGNGHLFFEPGELRDINMALAEYYGDVLPDCSEDKPVKKGAGTEVSKDLQYYPTPTPVIERLLNSINIKNGEKVLEPSCGCGRILDALRKAGANAIGIEVNLERVELAKSKGHNVLHANFLETVPTGDFDRVVMNPPFYGKHYAQHVQHALKFLKPGGTLSAILPVTARYDHGLLDGRWQDLPVGSFRESGTNVNTTILTIWKQ